MHCFSVLKELQYLMSAFPVNKIYSKRCVKGTSSLHKIVESTMFTATFHLVSYVRLP